MEKNLKKYHHHQLLNQMELLSQVEKQKLEETLSIQDFEKIDQLYQDVYVHRKITLRKRFRIMPKPIIGKKQEERWQK